MEAAVKTTGEAVWFERRQHRRYQMLADVLAFVVHSWPQSMVAAKITDIGSGGLALSHMEYGDPLPPPATLEFDILLPGGIPKIKNIIGTAVWDVQTDQESDSGFVTRRCGVRFEHLADEQKAFLAYVIQGYTTAGAETWAADLIALSQNTRCPCRLKQ
jgi:hypothetical protein